MSKIQQTESYDSFKRIAGNRTINKAQVQKLYNSIGENPDIASAIPIIVNENMEIIDGQHRFHALRKLQLPIYYLVIPGLKLKDVQLVNSATKTWTPIDYAKSFSEQGLTDYDIYLKFRKKYGLNHAILISYLGNLAGKGTQSTLQTFRAGKFKVVDEERAHALCSQLVEIQQYYNRGDTRPFAVAFKVAANHPQYDHARMMEKIKENPDIFEDSPYAEDYMRQLEKIYNWHCGVNRVKLF